MLARRCCPPTSRHRDRRRRRPRARAAARARAHRLRPAGRLHRPGDDRSRRARDPGPAVRDEPPRCRATGRRDPRGVRPDGGRGSGPPAAIRAECGAGSTSASASSIGPQVLFLDEPTTGLDPQARANMWDEIRGCATHGTTIFLTTHYLEEADALCDRLAIIDHGRDRRRGHGRRAEAPGGGRRRDARRRRRPASACSRSSATQPYVREATAEDGAGPPLRRQRRHRRAAAPPPARRRRPRAARRSR